MKTRHARPSSCPTIVHPYKLYLSKLFSEHFSRHATHSYRPLADDLGGVTHVWRHRIDVFPRDAPPRNGEPEHAGFNECRSTGSDERHPYFLFCYFLCFFFLSKVVYVLLRIYKIWMMCVMWFFMAGLCVDVRVVCCMDALCLFLIELFVLIFFICVMFRWM